ncbi:hypothetical protein K2173_004949 [Erythroxylum novogranatense]|uniref:U-box domain-containing protein n=1 Tax=Erythroxylum novogranatense TaxID=1862640 RepID=A0AAV8TBH0_9ROSI|nr:hypothetical protein K2173_004949 [Erythroxylum novogranatense]
MSSEDISLQNGLNSQLVFQDENLRFNCPPTHRCLPDPSPKTRQLAGFIDDKFFASDRFFPSQFPRNLYPHDRPDQPHHTNWNPNATDANDSGSDSDDDDDDQVVDDDDVDGDQDNGVDALVAVDDNSNSNNNNNNANSSKSNTISNTDNNTTTTTSTNPPTVSLVKFGNGNGKANHHSSFESSLKVMVVKDGGSSMGHTSNNASDTVAEADGEMYYSQYLQATEGSGSGGKDMGINNGCGFSGRKELSACSAESGESLRAILSDPVTGALMDDAMILPCGHSFGGGGIQHVIRMKACYTCSQSIVEDAISPNLCE